jgi:hypothetical protein
MGPSDPNAVKPGAVTGAPGQTTANATATSGTPADPPGWLGRQFAGITSWAKDNQTLASGLVNGGFGLLKGLGGTTDAQNNYYNANAQANLDLAKLRDQQYANIAAPKAVAYSPPVGSVPALGTQLPGAAGLINRAPTSAVTGATA